MRIISSHLVQQAFIQGLSRPVGGMRNVPSYALVLPLLSRRKIRSATCLSSAWMSRARPQGTPMPQRAFTTPSPERLDASPRSSAEALPTERAEFGGPPLPSPPPPRAEESPGDAVDDIAPPPPYRMSSSSNRSAKFGWICFGSKGSRQTGQRRVSGCQRFCWPVSTKRSTSQGCEAGSSPRCGRPYPRCPGSNLGGPDMGTASTQSLQKVWPQFAST
mmetsp:Transcript_31946/g.105951  ORF Transcript_31946/g.105951 Transcript_31946/m.105951 type:complete len:218 (+) Transcript_31946:1494-2147(+)